MSRLDYDVVGDALDLYHAGVPAHLRGRGIAGEITKAALEWARANGRKVVPSCPYVRAYIQRHPEYSDLVWSPKTARTTDSLRAAAEEKFPKL